MVYSKKELRDFKITALTYISNENPTLKDTGFTLNIDRGTAKLRIGKAIVLDLLLEDQLELLLDKFLKRKVYWDNKKSACSFALYSENFIEKALDLREERLKLIRKKNFLLAFMNQNEIEDIERLKGFQNKIDEIKKEIKKIEKAKI